MNEVAIAEVDSQSDAPTKSKRGPKPREERNTRKISLDNLQGTPIFNAFNELVNRDSKADFETFALKLLSNIDEDDCYEAVNQLTPLSWRIEQGLTNPDMREKLLAILNEKPAH